MKKSLLLSLGLVSGVAIACTIIDGVSFDITYPGIDVRDVAGEIGGALQDQFGSRYGRGVEVSGVVRYTAKIPIIGIKGGLYSIPFTKPCGKTFQEEANERWPLSASVAGVGGGGMCGGGMGGGLEQGVVGYKPVYRTATVSVRGGESSSQIVLVGYEPVYGLMPAQDSITAVC
ncbi:hypothetical protein K9F17_09955 [Stenotrophomonas acidaminiphila]|nr:hypothetical protein [Stenotrophomonas acidaminiphila]